MKSTDVVLNARDFRPGSYRSYYDIDAGCFRHNYNRDLHMFVLWERARPEWDDISQLISQHFSLIHSFLIRWSRNHISNNFLRLYGSPPNDERCDELTKNRREAVGEGEFLLMVVEDLSPVYGFEQTFSGKVELVNTNITAAKAGYRKIAGGGIRIHSSNSLAEFFRDCTLILGIERLRNVIESPPSSGITVLEQDLAGTNGWQSSDELFEHLLPSVDYVALRNFESLPDIELYPGADLDVLVRNAENFAAVANAPVSVERYGKFACDVKIGRDSLKFDVRCIGDGYYDPRWQDAILRDARLHMQSVPVPSAEDHFFGLLYHVKLHKKNVSEQYVKKISDLAIGMGLKNFNYESVVNDGESAKLIAGYLCCKNYERTTPKDPFLSINFPFARLMSKQGIMWKREVRRDEALVASIVGRMPLLWRLRGGALYFLSKAYRYVRTRVFIG